MEVDLLCADARVAIELDGAQHLGDPTAYRRDRRKDQLLQENDYLVLRFLAEDVGKDLDVGARCDSQGAEQSAVIAARRPRSCSGRASALSARTNCGSESDHS